MLPGRERSKGERTMKTTIYSICDYCNEREPFCDKCGNCIGEGWQYCEMHCFQYVNKTHLCNECNDKREKEKEQ